MGMGGAKERRKWPKNARFHCHGIYDEILSAQGLSNKAGAQKVCAGAQLGVRKTACNFFAGTNISCASLGCWYWLV